MRTLCSTLLVCSIVACGDAGGGAGLPADGHDSAQDSAPDAAAGDADDPLADPEPADAAPSDVRDAHARDPDGDTLGDSDAPSDSSADANADTERIDADADVTSHVDASSDTDAEPHTDADPDSSTAPLLFDMALIHDTSTIDCRFENPRTELRGIETFDVWDVSFVSYEVNEGALTPIRIRGFAARPSGARGDLPGIANVHGLGGHATPAMATGPAQLLGYFVIAATGPGGGSDDPRTQSEGRASGYDGGYRIFDVATDPRGSWLWGHAVAAMRGLTCLSTQPGVDIERLGITGFSGGGIATLIAASVDERVKAAVPLSGTGGWPESAAAPASWFHALLTAARLDTTSDEWAILTSTLDPAALVGAARAPIMMVNGSTDEFFPLAAHQRTYAAINPAVARRTSIAANFDHGCYSLTGGESAGTIEARAALRAEGGQRLWFHHHFGTDPDYAYLPAPPTATATDVAGATFVSVSADPGGADLRIAGAKLWASIDSALTFVSADLDISSDGTVNQLLLVPYNPAAIWFVDVEYRTTALIGAERFSLSTEPHIPAGHVPAPRAITTCLP